MVKEGKLIRQIGFINIEEENGQWRMKSYLNNLGIDNYFLNTRTITNPESNCIINGATIIVNYKDFYNNKFTIRSILIRNIKFKLFNIGTLFNISLFRIRK